MSGKRTSAKRALALLSVLLAAARAIAAQPAPPAAAGYGASHGSHAAPAASTSSAAGMGGHHMTSSVKAAPVDVASADALLAAFYASISGPAGTPRDRDRFVSLFFPGARLLPAEGKGHSGTMPMQFSATTFLLGTQGNMVEAGFLEREIARRSEAFGKVMHVWSTYEVRHAAGDEKPFVRGINSFQLFFDGKRWWIFGLVWQPETAQAPLPADMLR